MSSHRTDMFKPIIEVRDEITENLHCDYLTSNILALRLAFVWLLKNITSEQAMESQSLIFSRTRDQLLSPEPSPLSVLRLFSPIPRIQSTLDGVSASDLDEYVERIADAFGNSSQSDIIHLAGLYEVLQDTRKRKKRGAFFTPPDVAREISKITIDSYLDIKDKSPKDVKETLHRLLNLRILDNACGGGIFLISVMEYLKEVFDRLICPSVTNDDFQALGLRSAELTKSQLISSNIFGLDIEPMAIAVTEAQFWLFFVIENGLVTQGFNHNLRLSDSLLHSTSDSYDIVIGNPPYRRVSSLSREYKEKLRDKFKTKHEYNLHALFLQASVDSIRLGGCIGYLVHKNLFSIDTYQDIRNQLLNKYQISQLVDCGSELFRGVTAETSIIILKKQEPDEFSQVRLSTLLDGQLHQILKTEQFQYRDLVKRWKDRFLLGLNTSEMDLLERLESLPQLGDYVEIHRGIETGDNKRFLNNEAVSDSYLPIIRGRNISKFSHRVSHYIDYQRDLLSKPGPTELHSIPKVVLQQNSRFPIASYEPGHSTVLNSATYVTGMSVSDLMSLCVFLNSGLMSWVFRKGITNSSTITVNVLPNNLALMPLPLEYDKHLFQKICQILTVLKAKPNDNDLLFERYHNELAESFVLLSYFPESFDFSITPHLMQSVLSLDIQDSQDLDSLFTREDFACMIETVMENRITKTVQNMTY